MWTLPNLMILAALVYALASGASARIPLWPAVFVIGLALLIVGAR